MAAMEDLFWMQGNLIQINQEKEVPDDGAVEIVLFDYGNTVAETTTHLFPPYIQVVETDDGPCITWFAQAFTASEPEASVLKRSVIREYVREAWEQRFTGEDDYARGYAEGYYDRLAEEAAP